ncbi:protein TolR [Aquabacterium fontiphilum]|jgi:biopolymer transport protein TolR|uniref:biopolymer transporter ExbD n=1 Tax=Aquabacterium fontiphilum TaxID=450365 RepID=UPI00137772F9|nr:biopolymer transporter ExbD [Aquabacterium fontiphilum]NBD20220.1 protein TolR [Aquabacterium fontiphilum]
MAEQMGRRGRRVRNEINMVPFIDVMLVLLIIFMVSAPLMPTGVVDLPSVGKAQQPPQQVIELVVEDEARVRVRVNQRDVDTYAIEALAEQVRLLQAQAEGGPAQSPVIISARKDLRYDTVIQVMDRLQRAGVARVGLSVRTTGA